MDPTQWPTLDPELRLLRAGVSVELHSYPGTFHGSGLATEAAVSKRQVADLVAALAARLAVPVAS